MNAAEELIAQWVLREGRDLLTPLESRILLTIHQGRPSLLKPEAQDTFDLLLTARRWVPVEEYGEHAEALTILGKSGVLWTREHEGIGEIRISAPLTNRLLANE